MVSLSQFPLSVAFCGQLVLIRLYQALGAIYFGSVSTNDISKVAVQKHYYNVVTMV